ncbi:MAG: 2-succinyl-5-enolpyruvyl-6-hydroxy-3-cyclohexene-1-carboxylic-acid synthase [Ilumatobacteraceae bacterium]
MTAVDAPTADVQATFCGTLVDEWIRCGVRSAFVAPGSRSTPVALALAADERIALHVFHDERSAAFAALGAGLRSGRPSLLLCTSGTAATHFHAAVVEADLAGVPMVVVTADRPPELQGVGAPQTIRQDNLYGGAAHWFHDPGVPTMTSASSWRELARRCVLEARRLPSGAVHLNLPFREPLVGVPGELPPPLDTVLAHDLRRPLADETRRRLVAEWSVARPLLVAGRGTTKEIVDAAVRRGWPVVAESRVRDSTSVVTHFDSLVRDQEFADEEIPDLVVRVGDPPASKVLGQWMVRHHVRQIHVSPDGRVFDPDRAIAERIVCDADELVSVFVDLAEPEPMWTRRWGEAEERARDAIDRVLRSNEPTGASSVVAFVRSLPDDAAIVVSSSMPIRDLEWFGGPLGTRRVFSNRGANGIDGVIATAIGVATEHSGPVGVVIGDVATLHDSSSLAALARRGLDLRILVVDNDGGGIFHHLPQKTVVDPRSFELLYGTPHGTDFAMLATAHGLTARVARSRDDVQVGAGTTGPHVTVVKTDRERDVAAHRDMHKAVADALRDGR